MWASESCGEPRDATRSLNAHAFMRVAPREEYQQIKKLRPDWVAEKVEQINLLWFEAYSRIYEIVKLDDGSSAYRAFAVWGPGKTAKVQCDASAMFSADTYETLVIPALTRQWDWLDCSVFHLDRHQCIRHLDHLLAIESLDAVEWTPDPTVLSGGAPHWFPMYRRTLDAGKSVQLISIKDTEIEPVLDAGNIHCQAIRLWPMRQWRRCWTDPAP